MRYVMKEKLFAWGNDFTIRDDAGRDAFFVDGKVFTLGDRLSFEDMQGHELARIEQKLLSWGKTYEIYRGDELAAVVRKTLFTLFHATFSIDVPGPDDLEARGDFWEREYTFTRQGRQVAVVSKRFFALSDTYGVDVADGEDDVLILAATAVIDLCCHEDHE